MKKSILYLLFFCITHFIISQELPTHYSFILQQIDLEPKEVEDHLVSHHLRPGNIHETIVVIPKIVEQNEDYSEYQAYILLVDSESGKILNQFTEKNRISTEWYSDAIVLNNVKIDSLAYRLSKDKDAFGIRIYKRSYSQPNPYEIMFVSLYSDYNGALAKVLDTYPIYEYGGETDTRCDGIFFEQNGEIEMQEHSSNGFRDINFQISHSEITDTIDEKDECLSSITKESLSSELYQFNGEKYVPQEQILLPVQYSLLDSAQGDLDKDGIEEKVAVYETFGEEQAEEERELIVFKKKKDKWEIWKRYKGAILPFEGGGMMGDPFQYIDIQNGAIVISHFGGSRQKWDLVQRFRYQNNEFELIGSTINFIEACHENKTFDYNLSTGKIIYTNRIEDCENETEKVETKTFRHKLKTLPNLGNYRHWENEFKSPNSDITIYY